jgi:hypothetical protein
VISYAQSPRFLNRKPSYESVHITKNVRLIGAEDVVVSMGNPNNFCRGQALLEGFCHGPLKSEVTLVCFRSLSRASDPTLVWERLDGEDRRVHVRILSSARCKGVLDRDHRALRPFR